MSRSGKILLYGSLFSILYISGCIFLHKDNLIEKRKLQKQEKLDRNGSNDITTTQKLTPIIVEEIVKREIERVDNTPKITIQEQKIEEIQNRISQNLTENRISFYRGSTHLTQDSKKILNEIAELLKKLQDINIIVKGYTDSSGSASLNRALSLKRAKAVKRYLEERGINPKSIEAVGFGEENLVDTKNPHSSINRRVEIEIRR